MSDFMSVKYSDHSAPKELKEQGCVQFYTLGLSFVTQNAAWFKNILSYSDDFPQNNGMTAEDNFKALITALKVHDPQPHPSIFLPKS